MSRPASAPAPLAGRKVTVVGLGRFGGGLGVTRWAVAQGANVTVSDAAPAEKLAESVAALADVDVALHLGGHEKDDFLKTDLLVLNPAVPKTHPLVAEALAAGVAWTTEINLFLERCRAPIAGVTGSVGKSTTTAMLGEILAVGRSTHVGGNIGRSLLERLDEIRPDHVVVLELSSFQLEDVAHVGISPHVALVTNLRPNHLDRHGTMAAYGEAKKNIFRFQDAGDVLVLNRDDAEVASWAREAPGGVEYFGSDGEPFELAVPGRHNQTNAQAAFAAAAAFGATRAEAQGVLRTFAGLPRRLAVVAEKAGVRFYNDSKCTTPDGAIVALESFDPGRCVLIAGGYDKHVSFDAMGQAIAQRAKALVAVGATAEQILAAVPPAAGPCPQVRRAETFAQAVHAAAGLATDGDVVLLSPACASYDLFLNYEQRGDEFVRIVRDEL